MKKSILTAALAVVILSMGNSCQSKKKPPEDEAKQWLKQFYTDYITACSKGASNEEMAVIEKKYCTAALIKEIKSDEEMDVNPYLNAQDCDTSTLKTLQVEKVPQQKDQYKVSYKWSPDGVATTIHVTLVRQQNEYKINKLQ
ncbi:DUF3828 domain-containing protein [Paraflavitalea sp. CAU 1676]|uniref:DUF3828 domain-containing protein n=1 Tax=Paraflavitalea sp. CAU 1676 TaxID=3032598 RepID=UPI0023D994B2|nr:DUF3828 domain-containing protein [Paraflavitalea sp. CAU 1676]MDF2189029.1 DUF3828 domain-containing protein [Paraflavitalea sp. CAU 1676]